MPVNIHGRTYATVAERLKAAHGEGDVPTGIASIETTFAGAGEFTLCRAKVTFSDGRFFVGTAEVTRGEGRGPQAQAPVETAETSAVGRALAMAGYAGSDSGLAGAEEIIAAGSRQWSGNGAASERRPAYSAPRR